jgi:4-amino-4-deoxy-L-arabinose transferase-like glycosyltransferase
MPRAFSPNRFWNALQTPQVTWGQGLLVGILITAFGVRIWSLDAGVPHAVGIDEPAVVGRVMRILNTGDWNPHIFDYPTLVIYLHTAVALLRFMAGASRGEWASLADFDVAAVYVAGRAVTAVLGTVTVWITFRMGREAASDRVGLLAAAQLAILPIHVRESHFILTDVPVTALTTLAVYLAMRMEQAGSWWPGVVAGLAAAAKYNGGVVLVAVLAGALIRRDPLPLRLRACGIAVAGAVVAFLLATPYVVLDLPTFLDSFASQMARFARVRLGAEPAWITYLKHFALSARAWLPFAAAGAVVVAVAMTRRAGRVRWLPVLAFASLFFYVLVTHAPGFARYALPLTPIICLLAAAGIDGTARGIAAIPALRRPVLRVITLVGLAAMLLVPFGDSVIDWQRQFGRRDTRQVTTEWLKGSVPRGSRIAVENSGPTHLTQAGFDVRAVELLVEHSLEWYAQNQVEYLIISSGAGWSAGYADAGVKMVDVPSLPNRPGPSIRVVKIAAP